MTSTVIRTFPSDHVTPVRAYAALRARSAGRPSFLFEWGGGRYAALGYRPRSEALYPNGHDTFATLRADMDALTGEIAGADEPAGAAALAAGLCQSLIGFVAYEALQRELDLDPWGQVALLGRFLREPTAVVFDHLARTLTIAGPSDGAVRRCAWELSQDAGLTPLAAPDPDALPEVLDALPADEVFATKAAAARARVAGAGVEQLRLARTYSAPPRGADVLDAYRALRVLLPDAHLFFLDFTETPFSPGMTLLGAATALAERAPGSPASPGGPGAVIDALASRLREVAPVGSPLPAAAKLARAHEAGPRLLHGGAAGYLLPGGGMSMALSRAAALLVQGELTVVGSADIAEGEGLAEAAQRDVRPMLAAIRAAQETQRAREAAAQRKAEAEKAAAEKAAAEKAEAEKAEAEKAAAEGGGTEQGGS